MKFTVLLLPSPTYLRLCCCCVPGILDTEEKMEAGHHPELITLNETENGIVIKTEIKEEPTKYGLEWDPLNGYDPQEGADLDPKYDSEEELPLPSQVIIKEEPFSDDEVATNGFSGSSVPREVDEPTISIGLGSCREETVNVKAKSLSIVCPFCEQTSKRANFSSHHLPRCKMWKKHLVVNKKKKYDVEDPDSSSGSWDQPDVEQDSTYNNDGGLAHPTIEDTGQSSTAQCPFCKMTVSRAQYSSHHLPRCTVWNKYLVTKRSIGRPPKRRFFNFQKERPKKCNISEEHDSELLSEQGGRELDVLGPQANLNNQEFGHEPPLRISRPVRKAKTACIEKLSRVLTDLDESRGEETAETKHVRKIRLNETTEEGER